MNQLLTPDFRSNLSYKDNTSVVCPNCRASLTSCNGPCVMGQQQIPPPCQACQKCIEMSAPCLLGGLMPHFPLPYVCRHWLYRSSQPISPQCCHLGNNLFASNCNQLKSSQSSGGTLIQKIDVQTKPFINSASSSRSGSPENFLSIPELVVSVNGLPVATIKSPWPPEEDKRVLSRAKELLETSGWYYGTLSWQDAATMLSNTKEGTFLLRDSSSNRCPFAISVQTKQGPTSIRIEYEEGKFWLDCERKGVTPQMHCIMELIAYYMKLAELADDNSQKFLESVDTKSIWVDHKGRVFSPITIIKPLIKKPHSLRHLCRLMVNSHKLDRSSLPTTLVSYMDAYPSTL